MVCVACLLPLFMIPIINQLPVLFDFIMARIFRLLGWEYRKPVRAPPACPIKPSATATKPANHPDSISDPAAADNIHKPVPVDESKNE